MRFPLRFLGFRAARGFRGSRSFLIPPFFVELVVELLFRALTPDVLLLILLSVIMFPIHVVICVTHPV